ncbi:MAG: YdiU family protein [Gemmatimonadaceae bacterium]|nr:YdiU family protein [Gemmatimonadaceae bacterium]
MQTPLTFDNRFVRELPGDADTSADRRQVLHACWSHAPPTPVSAPRLLAHAPEVAQLLDLSPAVVHDSEFAEVFGGNRLLHGMQPYAACYGGHQFGNWAGQLGDGRAISLGEIVNAAGERWELQLKGAGPTPYSRTADGRAVLRSSIREFLCSEAMFHLGVPTTRALSLVATGDRVIRDMFYDGNAKLEPGAVVCRVAPSFLRFGNYEILTARGDTVLLERLVDFTISRDFPHLAGEASERRAQWFGEVCERTARMIVHWMRVGFVHGVMNTDNMSILGLTIDYGPYGWLDNFDPGWTPNTTDAGGRRYRYGQQPAVAQWNLVQLANAIAPLFTETAPLQEGLNRYVAVYQREFASMTCAKFGFATNTDAVQDMMGEAYALLEMCELDYTLFFRALADLPSILPHDAPVVPLLGDICYDEAKLDVHRDALEAWVRRWHASLDVAVDSHAARSARMHTVNPRFIFRNYLAQQAIDLAESGDPSMIHTLLDVLRRPYDEQPAHDAFAARRPDWARDRAGCSMLSCSS